MCKEYRTLFYDCCCAKEIKFICKCEPIKKEHGCRKKQDKHLICKCKPIEHCSWNHSTKHEKRFICKCKKVDSDTCCHQSYEDEIIWDY